MALWTWPVRTPQGAIEIPVVRTGESPLPSKFRVYHEDIGYGEVPLVYPDDVRASKIIVNQNGVNYAVAKDDRVSIIHAVNITRSMSRKEGSGGGYDYWLTATLPLGQTEFNRVTRLEASLRVYVRVTCSDHDPVTPFHGGEAQAYLRLTGPQSYETVAISAAVGDHHSLFSGTFVREDTRTGTVAVDVSPGRYSVELVMRLRCQQSAGIAHNDVSFRGEYTVDYWTEIARG